jgi:hypothetical protein
MNEETKLQRLIMIALSNNDCLVFRNETAGAYVGKVIHKDARIVTLQNAMLMQFGLCVGSSDIIGIHKPTGRFLAVEVKTAKGKPTPEQLNFIEQVRAANGIAGIARSVQDALELLPRQ